MDKEELLQRARNSKVNEEDGVEQQQVLQGARYGGLIFSITMVVLIIYTLLKWRMTELNLVLAIMWLYIPANLYGMLKATNKKQKPTLTMIVCLAIALALLVSYFIKSW